VAVGFILVSLMVALVAIRRVVRIDPVRALQME
jgi:hypothetical protein